MTGIRIERERCIDLGSSLDLHWVAADGAGACASSTVPGCATSRGHGLLVAPAGEAGIPHLFLSRFEETLEGGGRRFPLSLARYPGTWHPAGHEFLDRFDAGPPPRAVYRIGDVTVEREVRMARGAGAVLVRWTVRGSAAPETLRLRPFLPCREAGALTRENVYLDPRTREIPGGFAARPYASLPAVSITVAPAARFHAAPHWYRDVEFEDGGREDQFTPGEFEVPVAGTVVAAATVGEPVADPAALWRREERRRPGPAADAFLATAGGRPAVIPAFPPGAGGAREALVALPGLTLARGRVKECGAVLAAMGPRSEPLLWIRAVGLFAEAGGRTAPLVAPLLDAAEALPAGGGIAGAALRIEALSIAARLAKGKRRRSFEERRDGEAARFSLGDGPVGPGAVIAASLGSVPLERAARAAVVDAARADLLTPRGLRTLSPRDPSYDGGVADRGAAHPWLLGAYAEALVRARGRTAEVRREIRALVDGFRDHRAERGLGFVSERFHGDPPHGPAGAFADGPAEGELARALRLAGPSRR